MREQRVLLEDQADRRAARARGRRRRAVEPRAPRRARSARGRAGAAPRSTGRTVVLPAPRARRGATVSRSTPRRDAELEGAKGEGDVELELRHERMSLYESRTAALSDHQQDADRERDVEVGRRAARRSPSVSVCVSPRTLPGEDDRRAELADPAREGEHPAGDQAAGGERERDAAEACAPGDGAERARGVGQRRVDGLERGDRLAQVERRGDERDRDHHRPLGERQDDPGVLQRAAEQPAGAERRQQPDPATAGGSTSGSSISVMTSARPGKRRVASR